MLKKSKTKALTVSGKEHTNWKGKIIPAKSIKNTRDCSKCSLKCSLNIDQDCRQSIFDAYYNLTTVEQRYFILNTTCCNPVNRRTTKNVQENVKNNSFSLFFDRGNNIRVQVCKTFYLDTLSVSQKKVYNVHTNKTAHDTPKPDGRGTNTKKGFSKEVKGHIRRYIKSFPVMESHYCRADSKKQYLEAGLSITKMYELYVEFCSEQGITPVKRSYYRYIFCSEFNLDFHQPKKDRCDFCEAHRVKLENNTLTDTDNESKMKHDADKAAMREIRKVDREQVDNEVAVVAFDLQNVITCPRAEISCFFFISARLMCIMKQQWPVLAKLRKQFVQCGPRLHLGGKVMILPALY